MCGYNPRLTITVTSGNTETLYRWNLDCVGHRFKQLDKFGEAKVRNPALLREMVMVSWYELVEIDRILGHVTQKLDDLKQEMNLDRESK